MLKMTDIGLFCEPGNFYIDPLNPCDTAVITHAHADHARAGMNNYICTPETASIMRSRIDQNLSIKETKYNQSLRLGKTTVSFHSAGHVLGSAQIKIQFNKKTAVITGDYKRAFDPTCPSFDLQKCDIFVSEATFANPKYIWPPFNDEIEKIYKWYEHNYKNKINSIIYCYSLGKSQRLIKTIKEAYNIPVYAHQAIRTINKIYMNHGISNLETKTISKNKSFLPGLIVIPPGARKSKHIKHLIPNKTAMCSGWALNNYRDCDTGFVLSDHADWNDLIKTIEETEAKEVVIIHGSGPLLRKYLNEKGITVTNYNKFKQAEKTIQLSIFQ